MTTALTPSTGAQAPSQAGLSSLFDPNVIASMASALFGALPGEQSRTAGVQAPANLAPAGSPLSSPAGFGPVVPGTPVPQGVLPGTNLIPASPTPVLSLAHRVPSLLPHAQAGNGLPDTLVTQLPAYEPRFGSGVLGVPEASGASASEANHSPLANASPYYFLNDGFGHPSAGGFSSTSAIQDGFSNIDFAQPVYESPAIDAQRSYARPQAAQPALDVPAGFAAPATPQSAPAYASAAPERPDAAAPSASAEPVPAGVITTEPKYYFVDAVVLPSGHITPAKAAPGATVPVVGSDQHPPFDVNAIRRDFPILQERVNGRQIVWFDNAATTQKPQSVIDRLSYFYAHENSNIHRAAHELAARATDAYESAREKVRAFINAPDVNEVIFVRGTTEAINLVAKSWGGQHVSEGDEIIVSHLEHHANIVPWQQLASAKGARLRVIPVDDSGQVLLDEYAKLLNDRTKVVSVTQVSNALGTVVPVKQIVEMAQRSGAIALVDGAQSVSHMQVDVQDIGADFFVFSGHKVFGPTGIGALWGKRTLFEDMPPWQGGGNMIADVTFEKTVFQPIPNKFEAGTGNIADAVGLGAAIDYVQIS